MEPIKLEIFIDDKTRAGMQSAEGNISEIKQYMQNVITQLEVELKDLQQKFNEALGNSVNADKEMADVQALKGVIEELKAELEALDKQKKKTNSSPIIGDDPAPKLNNVKMSMQQIARELPSLAMGPQMFFLAISNNIPMFTDAVASARREYELLTGAGKKATPVWRQLLSSLFSWQTAMAAAITLSVVYGKEIGEFISQLFKGKKAALSMAEAQEKVNDAMQYSDLGKQIVTIRSLQERWIQLGNNLQEKKKFIKDNREEFDKLGVSVTSVDEAENTLVENTAAFIEAMTLRAEAAAAFKLASEEAEKALRTQTEIDKRKKKGPSLKDKAFAFLLFDPQWVPGSLSNKLGTSRDKTVWNAGIKSQEIIKKTAEEDAEAYTKTYNQKLIESANKLKEAGIKDKDDKKPKLDLHDYMSELSDARIRAQQKLEEARIAVMSGGYDKRKALAKQELQETLNSIDKEERETIKKMEAAKKQGKIITPEQYKEVNDNADAQRTVAQVYYAHEIYAIEQEWRDKNIQAWIDYNKEYGNYQDKRLAITQDYALRISKAETKGERAKLKKDEDRDLKSLDFENFKKGIDFTKVFGDLNQLSSESLSILYDNLKEYIEEADKTLAPEDLKEVMDAFKELEKQISDRSPFDSLIHSYEDYKSACESVSRAESDFNDILNGREVLVGTYIDKNGKIVKQLLTLEQAEKNVSNAQDKRYESMQRMGQSVNSIGSKGRQLVTAGNDICDMLTNLGVQIPESISGTLDGLGQVMSSLESIDLTKPFSILTSMTGILSGIAKSIGSVFGLTSGADYSRYNEMKDKYEALSTIWDELIDKKKEYIHISYGEEAVKVGQEALDVVQKSIDSKRILGLERLGSGASAGSSSIGVRIWKNMSREGWAQARESLGDDWKDTYDDKSRMKWLFDLSAAQLEKLKEADVFWNKLDDDVRNYLEGIIEGQENIDEINKSIKEQLTQTSFDSVFSSFIDTLMDMDSSAENFADDFASYMQKSILSTMIAKSYQDKLQAWYDSFADANREGGIDSSEYGNLKTEWDKIVRDALKERDELKGLFGWTGEETGSSQSGRAGSFTTMTQEQGTKLEGLFTSLQDHAAGMHKLIEELKKGRDADHELLVQITENTAYCKMLEPILEICEQIERNGLKMKG